MAECTTAPMKPDDEVVRELVLYFLTKVTTVGLNVNATHMEMVSIEL